MQLTEVHRHRDEDDEGKPGVEHCQEIKHGNDDVDDGRQDAEHDVVEQIIDARSTAIHNAQHLARLTTKMPPQRQTVQMGK